MEISDYRRKKISSILMIVVGIILLLCPGFFLAVGFVLGAIVLILAAILLIFGISQCLVSPITGVISIIVAILGFIFGWALFFSPVLVVTIFSILVYLIGIIFILVGIANMFTSAFFAPFSLLGIVGILFGIAFIIAGIFIGNPYVIATIIGIWLIISGVLSLQSDRNETYIDVNAYGQK